MHSTNDALTTFRYYRVTYEPDKEKMDMSKYTKQYRIFAKATIPVTWTETIDMHLWVKKNGDEYYKMQYRDNHNDLRIRCDTDHWPPHIDTEWTGQKQKKKWLVNKDKPKNYEDAINLILINAEQNNPRIGALYWIMPSLFSNNDDKVNQLEQFRFFYGINTSLTVVARAAMVKLFSEQIKRKERNDKLLNNQEILELLEEQCKEIAEQESKERGPLHIQEVSYRKDIVAFPFTIMTPPGSSFNYEPFPSSSKEFKNDLVGFQW